MLHDWGERYNRTLLMLSLSSGLIEQIHDQKYFKKDLTVL